MDAYPALASAPNPDIILLSPSPWVQTRVESSDKVY